VHATARKLGVPSSDLRRLVWATPALVDAVFEELERGVDQAVAILLAELEAPDLRRRTRACLQLMRERSRIERGTFGVSDRGGFPNQQMSDW
jgi:hypothetical protein